MPCVIGVTVARIASKCVFCHHPTHLFKKLIKVQDPQPIIHVRAWRDLLPSHLFPCAFVSMKHEMK